MKIELDKEVVTMGSGAQFYPNLSIVGISMWGKYMLGGGYDDTIDVQDDDRRFGLTNDDCVELADFMIARWQEFKNAHQVPHE